MSDELIGGTVARLRGLACPAGLAWTGDTPESDHGHTDCFIIHRAANRLEAAEARIAHLQAEYAAVTMHTVAQLEEELHAAEAKLAAIDALHQPAVHSDGWVSHFCDCCDLWFPCPTHRILHPEEQS